MHHEFLKNSKFALLAVNVRSDIGPDTFQLCDGTWVMHGVPLPDPRIWKEWIGSIRFQTMSRQEATLFFPLVSTRSQRGATLITTTKSVKDWPEILAGDEVMARALLDRLLHRCHVLNIKGRSYRLKDLERALAGAK